MQLTEAQLDELIDALADYGQPVVVHPDYHGPDGPCLAFTVDDLNQFGFNLGRSVAGLQIDEPSVWSEIVVPFANGEWVEAGAVQHTIFYPAVQVIPEACDAS